MWARKVGVPPGWASQVKVVALSVFTAGIGWAMFSFMANMSIGQLELGHPRNAGAEAVQCFLPTRETDRHLRKLLLRLRHRERTPELECHVKNMVNKTCSDVEVPVASINGHMVPMAGGVDWLRWWAKVFLVLSLLLLLGITTHDLAMLSLVKQEEIMDFRSLRWQFPVIRRSFALLAGVKVIRQLLQKSGLGRWAQLLSRLALLAAMLRRGRLRFGGLGVRWFGRVARLGPSKPSSCVVLLHGLGDTAEGWLGGAHHLAASLPETRFVLPTAPTQPVSLNGGMPMPSWYDIRGLGERSDEPCDGIEESRQRVEQLIQGELDAGLAPEKI
ncbi:unnamed protein product, partial [Effrenium voratum]